MEPVPLRLYPATPEESEEGLHFYASGGTGLKTSDRALRAIKEAINQGAWKQTHQILARRGTALVGAIPFFLSPSRIAVIAYPAALPDEHQHLAPQLVSAATRAAQKEGAKLCLAMIPVQFPHGGIPFLTAGYRHVATLINMELDSLPSQPPAEKFRWLTYDEGNAPLFERTFASTLKGTLDCPSLPRVQTPAESISGHKVSGKFRPDLWFIALEGDAPIGCVFINQFDETERYCLVYLGVVPEKRGHGYGELLARKAIYESTRSGASSMSLSVDELNLPAVKTYERIGFRRTTGIRLYAVTSEQ